VLLLENAVEDFGDILVFIVKEEVVSLNNVDLGP